MFYKKQLFKAFISYLNGSDLRQNICVFPRSTHGEEGFQMNPLENKAKHKVTKLKQL